MAVPFVMMVYNMFLDEVHKLLMPHHRRRNGFELNWVTKEEMGFELV
jgi:hypothetical protein